MIFGGFLKATKLSKSGQVIFRLMDVFEESALESFYVQAKSNANLWKTGARPQQSIVAGADAERAVVVVEVPLLISLVLTSSLPLLVLVLITVSRYISVFWFLCFSFTSAWNKWRICIFNCIEVNPFGGGLVAEMIDAEADLGDLGLAFRAGDADLGVALALPAGYLEDDAKLV